jgi:hypothetical protein
LTTTRINMMGGGTMDIRQSDDLEFWLVTIGGKTLRLPTELGNDLAHRLLDIESHAPVRVEFETDDDVVIAIHILEAH